MNTKELIKKAFYSIRTQKTTYTGTYEYSNGEFYYFNCIGWDEESIDYFVESGKRLLRVIAFPVKQKGRKITRISERTFRHRLLGTGFYFYDDEFHTEMKPMSEGTAKELSEAFSNMRTISSETLRGTRKALCNLIMGTHS